MDFRKDSRGTGATKGVDLFISFYENAVVEKDGAVTAHYGEAYGHPDAPVSKDQSNLALVTQRTERDGKTLFSHSAPFYPKQMEAIIEAAGDNTAPLKNKDGKVVGTIYGVKADVMTSQSKGKTIGFIPNTKTLQPSELSVAEVGGLDIRSRAFAAMKEAKAAREAEKAKEAPVAEVEAEQVLEHDNEPELV